MELDQQVAEAIANAKENGYDVIGDKWTSDVIATDMLECGGVSDDYSFADIVDAVNRYKSNLGQ